MRSVSAMALSSPKLGSVTITPSILSRLARKRSAHFLASSRGFDGAVLRVFRGRGNYVVAAAFGEHGDHFFAAGFCQMVGEETAVADDESEGHLLSA